MSWNESSIGDEGGREAEEKTGKWTIPVGKYYHREEKTIPDRENIITGRGKEWKYARVGLCHRPLPGQVGERLGRELGKWRSGALVWDQPAPCLCAGEFSRLKTNKQDTKIQSGLTLLCGMLHLLLLMDKKLRFETSIKRLLLNAHES